MWYGSHVVGGLSTTLCEQTVMTENITFSQTAYSRGKNVNTQLYLNKFFFQVNEKYIYKNKNVNAIDGSFGRSYSSTGKELFFLKNG